MSSKQQRVSQGTLQICDIKLCYSKYMELIAANFLTFQNTKNTAVNILKCDQLSENFATLL